jgi:parallel beta-helix repeat protein
VGTGIIVVGADDTEIRNNTVQNNESSGVMVVSYSLMQALIPGAMADPATDPYPERTFIHDNTFMGNGTNPQGPVAAIGNPPLENVLWDGWVASGMASDNNAKFCLGTKSPYPSFRMFDGKPLACLLSGGSNCGMPAPSTDTTPYQCDLPALNGNPP